MSSEATSNEARAFLKRWYAYMDNPTPEVLDDLVAEDAGISSPAFYKPKYSKAYVISILNAVNEGFEDFVYKKEWIDGRDIILEFETRIGDVNLKGIDRITVDENARMKHIEVLIRPLNGLIALAEHVKATLAKAAA